MTPMVVGKYADGKENVMGQVGGIMEAVALFWNLGNFNREDVFLTIGLSDF